MVKRRLKFRERLDRYPPILIRLLTTRRVGGKVDVPSDRQLANACGLSMAEFKWVSYSTSWDEIPQRVLHAFLMGCDIDLEKRRTFRRLEYMRRQGMFLHQKRSPLWESQLAEMLEIWVEASP